jgi:single-strand DNA-binding protein
VEFEAESRLRPASTEGKVSVMAMGETWVTMIGNLTSEPVHHPERVNGHDVVSFGLRSIERRYDKERGEWGDGRQLAVRVTCWRKLAMSVYSCLGKGDPVIVSGRLRGAETAEEIPAPLGLPELEAFSIGPNLARCSAEIKRSPVREPDRRPVLPPRGNPMVTALEEGAAA